MKRLFFALWPSSETRRRIDKFNQSIKSRGLKKIKADNLHVTLIFLGNVGAESENMIRRDVENISIQSFILHFDQLVFWRKPKVLCFSTQQYDAQLLMLVNALKNTVEKYDIKIEESLFRPHITLARKARKLIDIDVMPIEWQAHSFCLVESCNTSEGVHYQVLQRWNFK